MTDTKKTKLFSIDSLFEKASTKPLHFQAADLKEILPSDETIPVLSAGIDNQGLAYYAPKKDATIIKNAISVSANGANSGAMFYQPFDFSILQDSYAIKFKNKDLTENQYLYLLTSLQKVVRNNYDWTNKAGWNKIKTLQVELPIDEENDLDLEYMESYIQNLKSQEEKTYKTLLKEAGLLPEKIDESDKKTIKEYFENKHKSKDFKVSDLFKVIYNPSLDKGKLDFAFGAEYPYFTRTVFNNGIAGYVNYYDEEHKIKGNSIAVGLLQMSFFYMSKDFYAGQFTKTIYPLFENFNEMIGLFFATLFNKQSDTYKSVLVRDFDTTLLNSIINVPVTEDEKVDFDFIEKLMKALKKESIQNVSI